MEEPSEARRDREELMTLTIDVTPELETRLQAEAARHGRSGRIRTNSVGELASWPPPTASL